MSKLSVETEYDKAVEALAVSMADCLDLNCNGKKCATCPTKVQQMNVYNSMADIDKLRVQTMMRNIHAARHPPEPPKIRHTRVTLAALWDTRGWFLYVLIFFGVFFLIINSLGAVTPGFNAIQRCLKQTALNVRDVNKDSKINCIDYAVVFKHTWDVSNNPSDCELVRNFSPDFNHLFVRIKWNGDWVYVEPSAYFYGYITRYTMKEFWEERYDARYNYYNETEYWMKYDR